MAETPPRPAAPQPDSAARGARQPLAGLRILVTRPEGQTEGLATLLRELGAIPVLCPTVRILPPLDFGPLDDAIRRLQQYDWAIFTSVNGVRFFLERAGALGLARHSVESVRFGAIGPATADALRSGGLRADFVPGEYVAEAIVAGIGEVAGQRILLARADIARRALADGLRARGAQVDEVMAYRTVAAGEGTPAGAPALLEGPVDVATFTSPSAVRSFVALYAAGSPSDALAGATIACIGPITAQAAAEAGLPADVVAAEHTIPGMVSALRAYMEE